MVIITYTNLNRLNQSLWPGEQINNEYVKKYNLTLRYHGLGFTIEFPDKKQELLFRLKYSEYL